MSVNFLRRLFNFFNKPRIDVSCIKPNLDTKDEVKSYKSCGPAYYNRTISEHIMLRARIRVPFEDCDHLKGHLMFWNRTRRSNDYNVSLFTFCDGSQRIRCNKCGHKWFKGQADWNFAKSMVMSSTNTPASSERFLELNADEKAQLALDK